MKVGSIKAREVMDSRGHPTIEVEMYSPSCSAAAMVPSGASTGRKEAAELRDGGKRFSGKGVLNAVGNVMLIEEKAKGKDFSQETLDRVLIELDGTKDKSRLGANAILAVSMAFCRLYSMESGKGLYEHISSLSGRKISLPVPQMNIINGGKHAGMENDIQEHLILPEEKTFRESLRACAEVYHELGKMLKKKFSASATHIADEGGFAPPMEVEGRLELILKAAEESGHEMSLALDCAASEFFRDGKYNIHGKVYDSGELVDYYKNLASTYGIVSI